MPYKIQLTEKPAGYASEDATGIEGHPVKVVVCEFTSSEDGELFISRLEGFPNILISKLPAGANVRPSMIDHLLAIIQRDLSATVYVNELSMLIRARAARSIQAGEPVLEDDITDINEIEFQGVDIPKNAAVVCLLSFGWRKGLFFDFTPVASDEAEREYDLGKLLGSYSG